MKLNLEMHRGMKRETTKVSCTIVFLVSLNWSNTASRKDFCLKIGQNKNIKDSAY